MDELRQKFNDLEEQELPKSFHLRLVDHLSDQKIRTPFYIIVFLLSANLLSSAWNLITRLAALDTIAVFKAALEGSALNLDYLFDLWEAVASSIPMHAIILFLLNLAVVSYLIYLFFKIKSSGIKRSDKTNT